MGLPLTHIKKKGKYLITNVGVICQRCVHPSFADPKWPRQPLIQVSK